MQGTPLVIPPEMQEEIKTGQQRQAKDDQRGTVAAGTTLPGALREVFVAVPDIEVGPYKVRRFVDADFARLSQLGHALNSFSSMQDWMNNPTITGPEAYNIIWLMTTPVPDAKEKLRKGVDVVKGEALENFSELAGLELGMLIRAVGTQLARYMGARLDYEPIPEEGHASPPQSSQPQ